MQFEIIQFGETNPKWPLVYEYYRLRETTFVKSKKWELSTDRGLEFEQYDNLLSVVYILAVDDGRVVGGARMAMTSHLYGEKATPKYSYMIRDAYLGRLSTIPKTLCDKLPPSDDKTWELTRCISGKSRHVGKSLMRAAVSFLKMKEAESCLILTSVAGYRLSQIWGFKPIPLGPVVECDSGEIIAFSINITETNTDMVCLNPKDNQYELHLKV